jgi:hypothetical protein
MLTLTSAITVPNITRCKVKRLTIDDDSQTVFVTVDVMAAGARVYGTYQCAVRNGSCQGLKEKSAPAGYNDIVEEVTVTDATGYTDLATLTGTAPARYKAAETALEAAGLLPDGTVA